MGNKYGCTCSDQIQTTIFPDRKELNIDLTSNHTETFFKRQKSRESSKNIDRVKPFLKDYANFKPSLTEQVKEVLSKLTKFERTSYTDKRILEMRSPVQLDNKTVYVGHVNSENQKESYGILYFPDGGIYEGYFKNDKMFGKGRLINAEGDYYEGDFENDKANNEGLYVSADGVIYNGSWLEDLQHGFGEEVYLDGRKYEGNFDNGKKKGKGRFSWTDGSFYEGQFNGNVIDGKGSYQFKDNRVYKGDWKDNKMHGLGVFIRPVIKDI